MRVREDTEWWEGQAAGAGRGREKTDQRGVGWDDFKTEYVGVYDATSYVNEIISIVFSRRAVSLSVPRGLIEKQRLQFCKIRTSASATDVDTRVFCILRISTVPLEIKFI